MIWGVEECGVEVDFGLVLVWVWLFEGGNVGRGVEERLCEGRDRGWEEVWWIDNRGRWSVGGGGRRG